MDKFLLSIFTALLCLLPARAATGTVTFPSKTAGDWTEYSWSKSGDDYTANVGGYTFTLEKGSYNSGNLVSPNSESIRVYAGANLTITAPTGTVMTLVEGLTASSSKATGTSVNGTNWKNETGTIKAAADQPFKFTAATGQNSITFSGNKQLRIKSITITYESEGEVMPTKPGKVVFTPAETEVAAGTTITMTSQGATKIYYTYNDGPACENTGNSCTYPVNAACKIEAWGENEAGEGEHTIVNYTIKYVDPSAINDELNATAFNVSGNTYTLYKYSSTASNVEYVAKTLLSSNAMQINTKATSSGQSSAIASTANPDNRIIERIEVTMNSTTAPNIQMRNDAYTYKGNIGDSGIKDSGFTTISDAATNEELITVTSSGNVFTFTPKQDYKYFILTTSKTLYVSSIKVYYKKTTKCAAPVFKNGETTLANNAVVPVGSKITLSTATEGATLTYTVAEGETTGEEQTYDAETGIVLKAGVYTLTATASKDGLEPASTTLSNLTIEKRTALLSFKEQELTVYLSALVNGEEPVAHELVNTNNLPLERITFSSDKPEVVSIDDLTNDMIFKGKGKATITATYPGDDTYKEATASYVLNVELIKPMEQNEGMLEPPVPFDESGNWMKTTDFTNTGTDFIRFEHESGVEIYYSAVANNVESQPQAAPARAAAANQITVNGETYAPLATEEGENKVSGTYSPYAADSGVDFTNGGTLKVLAKKGEVYSQPHTFTFAAVPTGVEGIEADAADGAEYYTLQGVRVANPDKGIYIRVLNGKAVKVAL